MALQTSIFGGLPDPRLYTDWRDYAAALTHTLELQGQDMAEVLATLQDTSQLDGLGRLRVSTPATLHEQFFEYDTAPRIWDNFVTGGATTTHSTARGTITLRTNNATSGTRAMRQTRNYLRHRAGKTQLITVTGIPLSAGTHSGNSKTRMGYYDDNNGVYFQTSAAGNAFVIRGNTSGSVTETVIPQEQWNLDRLNGRGPSRVLLDPTKAQKFIFDIGGFGAGRGRFGFYLDSPGSDGGQIVYAHQLNSANFTTAATMPLIKTFTLPIRYEVINDTGTGADVSMIQFSSAVFTEGAEGEEAAYLSTVSNGVTQRTATSAAFLPVLNIRLRDTFNGLENHGQVVPYEVQILNKSNAPAYFQFRGNPTLVGAVFADVDTTFSIAEVDTSATSLSGGTMLFDGYVGSTTGAGSQTVTVQSFPVRTSLGRFYVPPPGPHGRDILSIAVQGIGASVDVHVAIRMREFF